MEIKELQEFSKKIHKRLLQYYDFSDPKQLNLPITIKIMEELGELCNDVLAHSGIQRKEKLDNYDKSNIEEEFADVIITTFNLAHNMDVDLEQALKKKMERIEKRFV